MKRREFIGLVGMGTASMWLPGCAGEAPNKPSSADGKPAPQAPTSNAPYVTGDTPSAYASDGRSFALASGEHRIDIRDANGNVTATIGGNFPSDELGHLNYPTRAAWDDANKRLLVLEKGNRRVQAFGADGTSLGIVVKANVPSDLLLTTDGRIVVVDAIGHRVSIYDQKGALLRTVQGDLNGPVGAAIASDDTLHVVDQTRRVRVYDANGALVTTYGDELVGPLAVRFDGEGRLWAADSFAGAIVIYQNGKAVDRFQPLDANGKPGIPRTLTLRLDGSMFVQTV